MWHSTVGFNHEIEYNYASLFKSLYFNYTVYMLSILHHISPCTNLPWIQDVPIPKICSFWSPLTVLPSINQRSILTIVSHMMPLSYGMIFHMIYAVLQISPVSKVDSKPTYFRNHSHHSFLLPNTGPPPWQRLGTCLMSHDLCLTDWMVCLRIRWYGD